jgi:hypothetical protein
MTVEQKLDLVSDSATLGTTRNLLRVRKAADSLVVEYAQQQPGVVCGSGHSG